MASRYITVEDEFFEVLEPIRSLRKRLGNPVPPPHEVASSRIPTLDFNGLFLRGVILI